LIVCNDGEEELDLVVVVVDQQDHAVIILCLPAWAGAQRRRR
jgi:hypothetical protein